MYNTKIITNALRTYYFDECIAGDSVQNGCDCEGTVALGVEVTFHQSTVQRRVPKQYRR